jgi:hypothetical protein
MDTLSQFRAERILEQGGRNSDTTDLACTVVRRSENQGEGGTCWYAPIPRNN